MEPAHIVVTFKHDPGGQNIRVETNKPQLFVDPPGDGDKSLSFCVHEHDGVVTEGNGEVVQSSKLKYRVFIPGLTLQSGHRGLCRREGEGESLVILGPGLGEHNRESVFRENSSLEVTVHQRMVASKVECRVFFICVL